MKAAFYLRTSSRTNVQGDSEVRQREAICRYADQHQIELVTGAYDAAVSGTDFIQTRPGMMDLVKHCEKTGIKTILCESPDRFARDIIVQEIGLKDLTEKGISVIPVSDPKAFEETDDPARNLIRRLWGILSSFNRETTVKRLKHARQKKREEKGKCEGAKSTIQKMGRRGVQMKEAIDRLNAEGCSLRMISAVLAGRGYLNKLGNPFDPTTIQRMINEKISA
jgi:DNA invertase Pin-like site-specific DNA recombinase